MSLSGIKCCTTGKDEPFEYCLSCSLRGNPHKCKWPFALIAYMASKDASREGAGRSATQLTGCSRQVLLRDLYEFTEEPGDMWARFRGELGHEMVGRYADKVPDGLMEVRIRKTYEVDGVPIELSGKPDWVVPVGPDGQVDITDFKSTIRKVSSIKQVKKEHIEQVNIYANLLAGGTRDDTDEEVWFEPVSARVTYFDMESAKTIEVDVWHPDDTRALVVDRLRPYLLHQQTGILPDLLPSKVVTSPRTGARQVTRHPLCNYCAVRDVCDTLHDEGK